MLLERHYRRRRWIVGCIAVIIAVVVMLLTPPSRMVSINLLVITPFYEDCSTQSGDLAANFIVCKK